MKTLLIVSGWLILFFASAMTATGRDLVGPIGTSPTVTSIEPDYCLARHRIGKISPAVSNYGVIGRAWSYTEIDCFTGEDITASCEYPINSGVDHLYGAALWIGTVREGDTLVSTGADGGSCLGTEFSPDMAPFGQMIYRTTRDPGNPSLFLGAISEEDYIATYSDTAEHVDDNDWLGLPHRPLNIEVTQSSYAWPYVPAEDFVLVDYRIENIGVNALDSIYIGIYVDADVGNQGLYGYFSDDIAGFVIDHTFSYQNSCDYKKRVNLAWIADNDGDPGGGYFGPGSSPDITGVCLLRNSGDISFNWWVSGSYPAEDFGPRERPNIGYWPEDYRDFGTGGLGTPEGDYNKYYVLRNREVDYDQFYTSIIQADDPMWMYPDPSVASVVAIGSDAKYLLSFGPIDDLQPGDNESFTVAYVGGENFHLDPANADNLPDDPVAYYSNLNFADFVSNLQSASWVFDNPGVDTDGDGNAGINIVCGDDTIWVEGDGEPDFRAAMAPPAPRVWAGWVGGEELRIRWNGLKSETTRDLLTRKEDFEGYRVYLSATGGNASYALIAAYDRENFWKYCFDPDTDRWLVHDDPFCEDSLRCLYGLSCEDESFDPLEYTSESPLSVLGGDSLFYFKPCSYNVSEFGISTPITKIYPDQPYPSSLNPALADPSELTTDGQLMYFEYELTVKNLNPEYCYCVRVTAVDFGSPSTALPALESSILDDAADICVSSGSELSNKILLLQNYPNPFNAETEIDYSVLMASNVRLEIFNILGQKIATLVDGRAEPGYHTVTWNASDAASGVYLYRLQVGDHLETKKMVLIK